MKFPFFLFIELSVVGITVGVVFFIISAGIAFVTYKMLRKTVTMAFRMAVVAGILIVSLMISIALLFYVSGKKNNAPSKPASNTRKTR